MNSFPNRKVTLAIMPPKAKKSAAPKGSSNACFNVILLVDKQSRADYFGISHSAKSTLCSRVSFIVLISLDECFSTIYMVLLVKTAVTKALTTLADSGEITKKQFGKFTLFVARQDLVDPPSQEELDQMDTNINSN